MIKLMISDLHLEEKRPDMTDLFLDFLHKKAIKAEALYILGDFFEVWIGDDDRSPFNSHIINNLKKATQKGLPIFFMHGNRDFLIGKRFLHETGCQLLPEKIVINLFGTPSLLMHGDTLCTKDIKYLRFRKKSRNWFFQKLILMKSLKKRKLIADNYRQASKAHTSTTADYIMDITQEEVERVMGEHKVQHLIHGHTHRPAIHRFELNNKPATRTVLGPWHNEGSVLICKNNGEQELQVLTN